MTMVPGGSFVGGWIGVLLAAAVFVPQLILSPASQGGTGSVDITALALLVGAAVGVATGGVVGAVMAVVVGILWRCPVGPGVVAICSASVAASGVIALLLLVVGPDPQTLATASLGVTHVAGAAILIGWLSAGSGAARRIWSIGEGSALVN